MAKKDSIVDEVVSEILVELDQDHATYQKLHRKFHGNEDESVRHTHSLLVGLCKRVRLEILDKRK